MTSWTHVAVSLLPVLGFLEALVLMDSFKLVTWRAVLGAIAAGMAAAIVALGLNSLLLAELGLGTSVLSRYVAPLGEELLKALWVAWLIRRSRVGFLVDAAVLGFALGAGFSLVENVHYLPLLAGGSAMLAVVRGLGTAVLHGAVTSIFAIVGKSLADRHPEWGLAVFVPGWALAALLHSLFNHFLLPPLLTTAILLLALPLFMVGVFERSERATRAWLGVGFDSDVQVLDLLLKGEVGGTRVGNYLASLKSRFAPAVVGDLLCLLRVHLELSLRAKGLLLARQAGLEVRVGDDVQANLDELRYLERAVGRTGLLAAETFLARRGRELWQVYHLAG